MNLLNFPLLSALIFSPLVGLIPLFLIPKNQDRILKMAVFLASLLPLGFALRLTQNFQGTGTFEFVEISPWIESLKAFYRLGIDGLSLPLLLLTSGLIPLVILASWNDIRENLRTYFFFLLVLETAMLGVFCATDLLLFYVFWEAQLIPMYFLIGKWGGPRRLYATMKFFLYTMAGSVLMLAALIYLYLIAGHTFNLADLYGLSIAPSLQHLLFAGFAIAFAIKIPLFPFHTWLPDAHVEAPTGGSVILAGVLLKMGTYGLLRFALPLFPKGVEFFTPLFLTLAVIGILYGSLVSMVQKDLKKLVAYSSVAHMGFVVLGIFSLTPQGISGATLQMVNHGISTGALFLLVGMIYGRRHTRDISAFGGLASSMPLYTFFFMLVLFSSIAVPGTNGFVGEFLILIGTFKTHPGFASTATLGVIFGAVGMLWMAKRVFFGPVKHSTPEESADLSFREKWILIPLVIIIFSIGVAPGFLLKKINKFSEVTIDRVQFPQFTRTPTP